MDSFCQLIANTIHQPNDLLDATAQFMTMALDIACFIIVFRNQLNIPAMLGAQFPNGLLLVNIFINS
jgi:hypothetical protein